MPCSSWPTKSPFFTTEISLRKALPKKFSPTKRCRKRISEAWKNHEFARSQWYQYLLWRFAYFVRRFRSEEHTSELQSLMRISYAVFCLKKKKKTLDITQ